MLHNNHSIAYPKEQYEQAIQDYDKVIERDPNFDNAYNNRGNAYYYLGKYKRAIQDFDEAIECESDFAEAYGNRGAAHYYLKNYEQALADLNKSIELGLLGKDLGKVLYYRGRCYQKLGDKGKAQADFAKAKELGYKG